MDDEEGMDTRQEDDERQEREMLAQHVQDIRELHAMLDEWGIPHGVPEKLQERLRQAS